MWHIHSTCHARSTAAEYLSQAVPVWPTSLAITSVALIATGNTNISLHWLYPIAKMSCSVLLYQPKQHYMCFVRIFDDEKWYNMAGSFKVWHKLVVLLTSMAQFAAHWSLTVHFWHITVPHAPKYSSPYRGTTKQTACIAGLWIASYSSHTSTLFLLVTNFCWTTFQMKCTYINMDHKAPCSFRYVFWTWRLIQKRSTQWN